MHGVEKTPTWTQVDNTLAIGATEFTTISETNWQVGDILGLATTDFHGTHSE